MTVTHSKSEHTAAHEQILGNTGGRYFIRYVTSGSEAIRRGNFKGVVMGTECVPCCDKEKKKEP